MGWNAEPRRQDIVESTQPRYKVSRGLAVGFTRILSSTAAAIRNWLRLSAGCSNALPAPRTRSTARVLLILPMPFGAFPLGHVPKVRPCSRAGYVAPAFVIRPTSAGSASSVDLG